MGVDKEAIDIWKFGRPRRDLSLDETLAAPEPILSKEETLQREQLLKDRRDNKFEKLSEMIMLARAITKSAKGC